MPLEVAIGCLEIIIIRLHGTLRVVSNLAVSFCAILDCNIVISDVYTSINTTVQLKSILPVLSCFLTYASHVRSHVSPVAP